MAPAEKLEWPAEETILAALVAPSTVVTLGFGRILTELEAATRRTDQSRVDQLHKVQERRARLADGERMLLGATPGPRRSRLAHLGLKLLLDNILGLDRLLLGGAIWAMLLLLLFPDAESTRHRPCLCSRRGVAVRTTVQ